MADDERRMLFDLRGRRKNVVRAVYLTLAILMGLSLFLVVGSASLVDLIGIGGGTSSTEDVLDDQVERVEVRLAKDPTNEALLLSLTRSQIAAGNAKLDIDPETGTSIPTTAARNDYEAALESWNRYLKQAGEDPNPLAAQLVASTFFSLAETAGSYAEVESAIAAAATAQAIAAQARPSVGSLSTLAIYEYFNGNFEAGDKAAAAAEAEAPSKSTRKSIEKQLAGYRKRAKKFEKEKRKAAKAIAGSGKEALENPLGGLSGGGFAP